MSYDSGSWLSLPEVGVADLDGASIPLPTEEIWTISGLTTDGARDTLADPRPDSYDMVGLPGRLFGLVWFDRIHVLPRERDLGSVVSEQEIEVEIFNGYLNRAQTLDDIVVTGPAGIEVVDHLGLPAHYAASDSQIYTVEVSAEGDPQIDNTVVWEFDGLDSEGTALAIVGFRLIPFPFPPNMARPIEETFGYLTDVLTVRSGMEQRIQLRAVPIGSVSYSIFLEELREVQMAGAILFGNQPRAFGVGRWQFQTPLAIAATAEDTEVYCTTDDIPFEVGGLVMLWTSPFGWEVQTIDSVESDHLVLTSGLRGSWPATSTAVLPMVVGRLTTSQAIAWESLLAVSQSVRFSIDGFTQ